MAIKNVAHWLFLGGLLLLVVLASLLVSIRGLGYPNPADKRSPVPEIAAKTAAERDFAVMLFALQCLDALTKNRYQSAVKSCTLALSQKPDDAALYKLRGNANFLSGNTKRAIEDFTRAAELAPGEPDGYRYRAAVYASLHRDREALADFNRAVAVAPDEPAPLEGRGYFYETRGQYGRAMDDLTIVVVMQPTNYHAWNSLCWVRFLAKGDMKLALAECDTSIRLNPDNANSFDSRGFVRLRLGRFAGALADFDQALKLKPNLATSLFGRGVAKLHLGNRSGLRDIGMAKLAEPGIEVRFFGYGIRVPTIGPSGT